MKVIKLISFLFFISIFILKSQNTQVRPVEGEKEISISNKKGAAGELKREYSLEEFSKKTKLIINDTACQITRWTYTVIVGSGQPFTCSGTGDVILSQQSKILLKKVRVGSKILFEVEFSEKKVTKSAHLAIVIK